MFKKMLLVFLCFTLFLSMPGCKKKLPTTPDIPTIVLPTIAYFTASPTSIMLDSSSTLSWSTTNATNITIDQGVGTVSAIGTVEVSPEDTTIYTLTATNSDGQKTQSCVVEILKWATLGISTIPEIAIWTYYPFLDSAESNFTVVLTESNGVGGEISRIAVGTYIDSDLCFLNEYEGGMFNPNGTLSRYLSPIATCKLTLVIIYVEGVDNNGYMIEEAAWYFLTWTANKATAQFLKIVEGQNHHKLIN